MEISLKNKVIFITGSSIGIGRETAFLAAREGAKVIMTYYEHTDEAKLAKEECMRLGAKDVMVLPLDISKPRSIDKAIRNIVMKFQKIDILVNNAAIVILKKLKDQTEKEIIDQVNINLTGLMLMTRASLPYIQDCIINIASTAGLVGYEKLVPYCGTKFGVRGFSQALSLEAPNVRVYVVNPGITATRMTNFKGVSPVRVAEIIINTAKGMYTTPSGGDINVHEIL